MFHETKFYINILSQTKLKNKEYLLEHANLPGYKLSFRNTDERNVVALE